MQTLPYTPESYQLLHDGAVVLSEIEANGMRVDLDYMDRATKKAERKIRHLQAKMSDSDVVKEWRKRYGAKTNFESGEQLGVVLFDVMGYKPPDERTDSGRYKTDIEALSSVGVPFVDDLLQVRKLQKAVGTYLKGILNEVVDGYVHPFFNLHLVRTYRGSSDSPNWQNIPVRDPEIRDLVRTALVPRPGRSIVEIDFSGIEVRIACCSHKDPRMVEYLNDPTKDMHRDMAMECYLLTQAEVVKVARAAAKSYFVFAQFYGDWFIDCARRLWEAIPKDKLVTASGTPMLDHLKSKGVTHLGALDPKMEPTRGSFEGHIKQVEKNFWDKRFPVYKQWKLDFFSKHQRTGYFQTLTGFICQGFMKRNEVINYGTQGSAFHCLLWVLIQLSRELHRRNMKTLLIGQIHDSIVADVVPEERDEYIGIVRELIEVKLARHWRWINVPMTAEAEGTAVDAPWSTKEKLSMTGPNPSPNDDRNDGWDHRAPVAERRERKANVK